MEKNVFRWEFGTCSFIDIYKNNSICAHFNYDNKLRMGVSWTTGLLIKDDWEQILTCVMEAKAILKKIKRI